MTLRSQLVGHSLVQGERYFPYKLFAGDYIPMALLQWPELSDIAKLAFGVVAREIGDNDAAVLYLVDIADALRVSIDTASRAIRCLEDVGLLIHRRTGRGSEYSFVWHRRLSCGLFTAHAELDGLKPGSAYRPWKKFVFVLVPISLTASQSLSYGAKLLFGLVSFHARDRGCYASDHTLAKELGKSKAQLRRLRTELEQAALLVYDPACRADKYHFLFQPILMPSLLGQRPGLDACRDSAEGQPESANQTADTANMDGVSKEEEIKKDMYEEEETNESLRSFETHEEFLRWHLLKFQGHIRVPLDCQPELVPILAKSASQFGLSLGRLGYLLEQVWQRVETLSPSSIDSWSFLLDAVWDRVADGSGERRRSMSGEK